MIVRCLNCNKDFDDQLRNIICPHNLNRLDDKAPSGPEDIPLRDYVKSYPLTVSIIDKNDKIIREEHIDYGNYNHRKWLGKSHFLGLLEWLYCQDKGQRRVDG